MAVQGGISGGRESWTAFAGSDVGTNVLGFARSKLEGVDAR